MNEVIQKDWLNHFLKELENTHSVYIISPFITKNIVDHLLKACKDKTKIRLITRYNLNDFRSKVSSLSALRSLVDNGAKVIGIKNLHSKVYIFDNKSVIIGSANLTSGGFFNNYEFGLKSTESDSINKSLIYFNSLWNLSPEKLTIKEINDWEIEIKKSNNHSKVEDLKDYGKRASIQPINNRRYFIKLFGKTDNREELGYTSREEIENSHCHWALTFSGKKGRPRKYRDGDIVYMARMLEGRDYAIFGKGIALHHVDKRDVASIEDKNKIWWKKEWPIYIRVHSTEFIDGAMGECPKMSELINILMYECFDKTNERHLAGKENINAWDSLRQQADVQLSEVGAEWLESKFQDVKSKKGTVPNNFIQNLYQGTPTINDILKK